MRQFFLAPILGALLLAPQAAAIAAPSAALQRAQDDVQRIMALVSSGALPRKALVEAQAALDEVKDQEILSAFLFGQIANEELTEDQATEMLAASQRSVERQETKVNDVQKQVSAGAIAQTAIAPYLDDLARRRAIHSEATERAELILELASMVHAEADLDSLTGIFGDDGRPVVERFDGDGVFLNAHLKELLLAFEKQFGKPFPVSARGETALHRSLGFDHRGRVDVAVSPDTREGVWLRAYLESMQIPFYAFRGAVKGKSTAAHFHLGPSSTRIRRAD